MRSLKARDQEGEMLNFYSLKSFGRGAGKGKTGLMIYGKGEGRGKVTTSEGLFCQFRRGNGRKQDVVGRPNRRGRGQLGQVEEVTRYQKPV